MLTFATANLTLLRPNCDNGGTPQQHWVITEVSLHGLVNAQFNIVSTRHTNKHCKDIKLIFEGEVQYLKPLSDYHGTPGQHLKTKVQPPFL